MSSDDDELVLEDNATGAPEFPTPILGLLSPPRGWPECFSNRDCHVDYDGPRSTALARDDGGRRAVVRRDEAAPLRARILRRV